MGFSWSSAIGQQVLLSVCRDAGLSDDIVVAPDADIPASLDLQYGVATDDVMIFSKHAGASGAPLDASIVLWRLLASAEMPRKRGQG